MRTTAPLKTLPFSPTLQAGLLVAALSVALFGCPPPAQPGVDGEVDAGVTEDAGTDAGTPTDAGVDAGTDGGLPPELKIEKVLPPRGPSTGGTQLTLQGSGFVRGVADRATEAKKKTTLRFGSNLVQDFQIIDDGTIDVRVPPGKTGLTNVTIENDNGQFVCTGCFTYFDEVFLKSATPKEGSLRGGNEVTLVGGGFTADLQVLFGGLASPEVTPVSATELKVVAPRAHEVGPVDITVYSKNGVGVLRRIYRYYDDLRVTSVAPLTGPLQGGTQVVVTGTGFDGATSVKFGNAEAQSFTVDSSGQLTAVTPAATQAGVVPLTITTPRETWTVRDGFFYAESTTQAAGGLAPHVGPPAGGNTVTVFGHGFDPATVSVTFGGAAATVTSATDTELKVVVPARGSAARKVDVTVTDDAGTHTTLPAAYTYGLSVSDLTPRNGPAAGGTPVALAGQGFPDDVQIFIGALAATVQGTPTETQVSVVTPKGQGGAPTDVWAREAADPENEFVLPRVFTYDAALSVGRVQPDRGAIAGGTLVQVLGSGFGEGTLVRFGTHVAKDIKVIDSHTLTCRTPKADSVGSVDITVQRLGQSDLLEGGFSYFDPRSISGGLSGGPLTGTLNITVLESTPGAFGLPVPLATVMLGADPFTPFQGQTDHRGQLTFSDPSLVKAQTVTAFKDGFETTTVTSVNAENLTVFVARTGGDGSPGSPPPGPPPSLISGRVTGFKAPRPLGPNETLEARVFVAQNSLYAGAPFRGPPNRQGQKWQVTQDGGEYLLATSAGVRATYAVLGVVNSQAKSFEPYLMGVRRGIGVSADNPATNQDIILDMHLDLTVPVTVDQPINIDGTAAPNQLYGWLDLGAEGFIPNPHNWGAGTTGTSTITSFTPNLTFPNFPQLDGANFIFMNLALGSQGIPYSIYFRRQPGDLSKGLTIGPMLPTPSLTSPDPTGFTPFNGTIAWTTEPGPAPDIHNVLILKPTLFGNVTLWSVVLPGAESQVTLPPAALQKLRAEEPESTLFIQILSSRSPKFSYNQWTYDTLSGVSWSSYTVAVSTGFTP